MKIYEVSVDYEHGYSSHLVDKEACRTIKAAEKLQTWEMSFSFDGTPKKDWWPRKMVLCPNDDGSFQPVGDFTSSLGLGDWLLEKKAFKKLKNVLENVQVLPVDCDFGDYVAINPLTVLDCLDYDKSELWTIDHETSDGRPFIVEIKKFVLKKDVLSDHKLFKIYDTRRGMVYVNQEFVKTVNENGITGFNFKLVWED